MKCLHAILVLGLATAASILSGCSSFRRDSREAMAKPLNTGVEGRWEGRWHDEKRPGHGGKLELVLVRVGDNLYRASTRSHFWKYLRASYDTTLVVTPTSPGSYVLQGAEQLRIWGGFSITGRVDSARFNAVYESLGHRGVMELTRPVAAPTPVPVPVPVPVPLK